MPHLPLARAVAIAASAAVLSATAPPRHAGARPPTWRLCAFASDAPWAQALARAVRDDGGRALVRLRPWVPPARALAACRGLGVGPSWLAAAVPGARGLSLRWQDASYLAGAALGQALGGPEATARPGPVVAAEAPDGPTGPARALVAGLAAGLRADAPAATALVVGLRPGAQAPQATVLFDLAHPEAFVRWQAGATSGRCGLDAARALARLGPPPGGGVALGAADGSIACRASTAAGTQALAGAAARLAGGLAVPAAPDYTAPPLAVTPYVP